MRIWLIPEKLASFGLMPGDVITAIQAQNTEIAAGEIGGTPMPAEQMLNATVTSQSRLQTPSSSPISSSRASGPDRACGWPMSPGSSSASRITPSSAASTPIRRRHRHIARPRRRRAEYGEAGPRRGRAAEGQFPARLRGRLPQRQHRLHPRLDRRGGEEPGRGDHPRRHRHVRVPAELARDPHPRHRPCRWCCSAPSRCSRWPASRSTL